MTPIATDGTSRPHHEELPSGHVENSQDAPLMEPIAPEHLTTDALMAMANAAAASLPRHPHPHPHPHLPHPSSSPQESPHGEERSDATFPSFAGQLTSLLTSASSPLSRLRSPFIMSLPDTFLSDFSAPSPFHAPHPNDMEIMPLHKCKYCSGHSEMFNAPSFNVQPRPKYQSVRPSYIPPSPVQSARPYFQPRPLLMMPYASKTNMGQENKGGNNQGYQQQQQQNNINFPTKGQSGGRYTPLPRPQAGGAKYPPPPPPAAYGGKGSSGGGGRQLLNLKDSSRIVVLVLHLDKSDQGVGYEAPRPIGPMKGPSKGAIVQMQEPMQKPRQMYEEQRKEPPQQQQIIYGHGQIKQATSPTITNNVYFDPERIQLPYSSATLVPSPTHESTVPSSSSSQDAASSAPYSSSSSSNTNTNHQPSDSSNSNMLRTTVTSSSSSATFTPSPREEDSTAFKPMTLLGHRMRSSPSASAAAAASSDVVSHSMDDVQRKMEDYASPVPLSSSLLPSLLPASFSSKVPVSSMSLSFKSAISSLQPSSQAVTSRRAPQRS